MFIIRQTMSMHFIFPFDKRTAEQMHPMTCPKYTTLPSVPYPELFRPMSSLMDWVPAAKIPMSIFMNRFTKKTQ